MIRLWLVVVIALGMACAAPAIAPIATPSPAATTVPATPTPGSRFPLTVVGDDGRRLVLQQPPRRMISLSPGHTEILFDIGVGERVVGIDDYADYPPAVQRLPRMGYANPDLERIVALDADLVIVVTRQRRAVPELERLGIPSLFLAEPESLEGLLERILLLGEITGRRGSAETVVADMRQRIEDIAARLHGVQGPTVFYELSPQLHTVGPKTFLGDMLVRLQLQNIAAGTTSPFPQLSQEQVISSNPDVIVLGDIGSGESAATVAARSGWQDVSAVRNGRIILVTDIDILHRPGPRVVEGMEQLARAVYPHRFPAP
ncbi:MAG: ABC transporter substrate-binding protein [Chloroflexi bacterium]|nr:ABC transporter substrate-binding protein [Chloroflexota bacterium]